MSSKLRIATALLLLQASVAWSQEETDPELMRDVPTAAAAPASSPAKPPTRAMARMPESALVPMPTELASALTDQSIAARLEPALADEIRAGMRCQELVSGIPTEFMSPMKPAGNPATLGTLEVNPTNVNGQLTLNWTRRNGNGPQRPPTVIPSSKDQMKVTAYALARMAAVEQLDPTSVSSMDDKLATMRIAPAGAFVQALKDAYASQKQLQPCRRFTSAKMAELTSRFHQNLKKVGPTASGVKCRWKGMPSFVKYAGDIGCGQRTICIADVVCTYPFKSPKPGRAKSFTYSTTAACAASTEGGKISCGTDAQACAMDDKVEYGKAGTQPATKTPSAAGRPASAAGAAK